MSLWGNAQGKTNHDTPSKYKGKKDVLDIVVNDAVFVEELDAREKGAEPFLRVRLGHLHGDEPGMVCPV